MSTLHTKGVPMVGARFEKIKGSGKFSDSIILNRATRCQRMVGPPNIWTPVLNIRVYKWTPKEEWSPPHLL